jgi:hypothetical protein
LDEKTDVVITREREWLGLLKHYRIGCDSSPIMLVTMFITLSLQRKLRMVVDL